jgi:hypothetical protein
MPCPQKIALPYPAEHSDCAYNLISTKMINSARSMAGR